MTANVQIHLLVERRINMGTVIAFYAYLSHTDFGVGKDHTLIFDTAITNTNSAYNNLTGVFTVPVGGVYGFTYNVRLGCSLTTARGPFEIVKNGAVEGVVVFINNIHCNTGMTVANTVIIQANQGDKVYIRTHKSYPLIGGDVISSENGRSSFAGWLI